MNRIKIVAIAKDEGAYLPEWIFHHLYFGVETIDIYINRTTDNSMEIIKKIQRHYPQVNFYNADWISLLDPKTQSKLQYIIYSKAFEEEKEKNEHSYILFIDIDEFWVPMDFKTTLPQFIKTLPSHSTVSFRWFNQLGENERFSHLENHVAGEMHPAVKSIVKLDSRIKSMRIHLPLLDQKVNFAGNILSCGSPFLGRDHVKKPELVHRSLMEKKQKAVILHRMYRSEVEYLSMLYKQNPEQKFLFKHTRTGFTTTSPNQNILYFTEKEYAAYKEQRGAFFHKVSIDAELEEAKQFVLNRMEQTIQALESTPVDKEEIVTKIFKGITHQKAKKKLDAFYKRIQFK